MDLKKEKLDADVLDHLKKHTEKLNTISNSIGQSYIRMRDAERIFKEWQKKIEDMETEFFQENDLLKKYLGELETKYPNGEIDLNTGEVTYNKE